jgi:hypothetical protein
MSGNCWANAWFENVLAARAWANNLAVIAELVTLPELTFPVLTQRQIEVIQITDHGMMPGLN